MLIVKTLHIWMVISWFAGLFYLPRIFVNLAMVPADSVAERDRLLLQTPESLRESLNLDVRTAHEVLSIDPASKSLKVRNLETGVEYTESYDKLAYCPGAEAMRPPIPGLDLPGVHVLRRIGDMDQIKSRVEHQLEEQVETAVETEPTGEVDVDPDHDRED